MSNTYRTSAKPLSTDTTAAFMAKVYAWMTTAILVTAGVSAVTVGSGFAATIAGSMGLFLGLLGLELVLAFAFIFLQDRLSFPAAFTLFLGYAAMNGLTFAAIFTFYSLGTVTAAFLLTAAMFASLSAWGFVTKKDLSGWGTFLFMGLIGLIGALIIEFFIVSSAYSFVVSCAAVVIFAGLTAYDTQKIKQMAQNDRNALSGAFALYLDFINLFLHLLRLMGGNGNNS